jgi:hypothetical protein
MSVELLKEKGTKGQIDHIRVHMHGQQASRTMNDRKTVAIRKESEKPRFTGQALRSATFAIFWGVDHRNLLFLDLEVSQRKLTLRVTWRLEYYGSQCADWQRAHIGSPSLLDCNSLQYK